MCSVVRLFNRKNNPLSRVVFPFNTDKVTTVQENDLITKCASDTDAEEGTTSKSEVFY